MGNLRPSATSHNTATKVDRHYNVPVFCLFGMGNLRPSATSHNTVPKETGTTMCLFFVYSAWGICAQAQLPTTRYQKRQALQCACFFVAMRGESERGIERRVKKIACGQAELFVGICSFALSLDLGKRRTGAGGFAEGRQKGERTARTTHARICVATQFYGHLLKKDINGRK